MTNELWIILLTSIATVNFTIFIFSIQRGNIVAAIMNIAATFALVAALTTRI